jgi:hypothetical protein
VCVDSLRCPACNANAPYCRLWPAGPTIFFPPTLPHKRHDFRGKKVIDHNMFVIFLYTSVWNISYSGKNRARYDQECILIKYPLFLSDKYQIHFLDRFSKDTLITNLTKILQWEPVVPCGRTDGQKDMKGLIVAYRNFANASKNKSNNKWCVQWQTAVWNLPRMSIIRKKTASSFIRILVEVWARFHVACSCVNSNEYSGS